MLYLLFSAEIEVRNLGIDLGPRRAISDETKSTVKRLSSLFAIDAFGGGFLTDAFVSYWFFRRFGIAESQLALLFFTVHVLNALSHLGAAWLAKRIGLSRRWSLLICLPASF